MRRETIALYAGFVPAVALLMWANGHVFSGWEVVLALGCAAFVAWHLYREFWD